MSLLPTPEDHAYSRGYREATEFYQSLLDVSKASSEAKDAEIERLEDDLDHQVFHYHKLCKENAKLQAVVDYVRTIDHLQANEYLHELIADLNTGEQGGEGNE